MVSPDSSLPEEEVTEAALPVDPDNDDLTEDELAALGGGRVGEGTAFAAVLFSNEQEGFILL